jgi:integrase
MRGHLRERSPGHWAIVIDMRDPQTGARRRKWHSFAGTKREAQIKCAELVAAASKDDYVEPSKATVADFMRARIGQWEAAGDISPRTAQRYRQLVEHQIAPHLGAKVLRKLRPLDIEAWHTALRDSVSARTIGHAHRVLSKALRVLSKALRDAAKNDLVSRNVCKEQAAPKVDDAEQAIVRDIPALMTALQGWRYGPVAMIALFSGLRLGEVLALRWNNVDLDRKVLRVHEALEQTKRFGIRFKPPKSKAGKRDVTMPDILVEALHEHRKTQLELRLQLGLGKLPDDALLFATVEGRPLSTIDVSCEWGRFAGRIGLPEITFHALRHTHASQLIDAGVDIVTISKRLGHSKPDITLRIYAHKPLIRLLMPDKACLDVTVLLSVVMPRQRAASTDRPP